MSFPFQVSDPGSRGRHRREPPDFVACRLIEGGDESVSAVLAARDAGDDEVACWQRSRSRRVVLFPVGHLGIPDQLACHPFEGDDVSVLGTMKTRLPATADSAIGAAAAHVTRRPGTLVAPDLAAVPASRAKHSLGVVTYMIPSATTGVVCSGPWSEGWKIHLGPSLPHLRRLLIWFSVV